MKKTTSLICIYLFATICLGLTGCQSSAHKQAVEEFEAATSTAAEKNTELDTAVSESEALIAKGESALDATLIPALETAISEAKAAKKNIPDMPKKADEITAATLELNSIDYTNALTNLTGKKRDLETSIKKYALVNAPSEEYIINCLKNVSNVVDISAVTEENDPNGNLNKAGGYTAQVYFSSALIDQNSIYGSSIIEKGTDCGGSIEVYATVEDAEKRNAYLGGFDGSLFASGSHTVLGTVIVRTSDELTASQQKEMEANIISALIGFDEATNQKLSFCGIDFSMPAYFDVLSEDSTETYKLYYPETKDYYATLIFQCAGLSATQDDFDSVYLSSTVDSMIASLESGAENRNQIIEYSKSEKTTIARMSGWIITFSLKDKDNGVPSYGSVALVYNINTEQIITILCGYESKDQSNYDYLGDYEKMLKSAVLTAGVS